MISKKEKTRNRLMEDLFEQLYTRLVAQTDYDHARQELLCLLPTAKVERETGHDTTCLILEDIKLITLHKGEDNSFYLEIALPDNGIDLDVQIRLAKDLLSELT